MLPFDKDHKTHNQTYQFSAYNSSISARTSPTLPPSINKSNSINNTNSPPVQNTSFSNADQKLFAQSCIAPNSLFANTSGIAPSDLLAVVSSSSDTFNGQNINANAQPMFASQFGLSNSSSSTVGRESNFGVNPRQRIMTGGSGNSNGNNLTENSYALRSGNVGSNGQNTMAVGNSAFSSNSINSNNFSVSSHSNAFGNAAKNNVFNPSAFNACSSNAQISVSGPTGNSNCNSPVNGSIGNASQSIGTSNAKERALFLLNSQWPEKPLPIVNQDLLNQLIQLITKPNFSIVPSQFNPFIIKLLSIYGLVLRRLPEIGERPVDLLYLHSLVTSHGGYRRITMERKWPAIGLTFLKINPNSQPHPPDIENLLLMVRCIYAKILFPYEQIFYLRVSPSTVVESFIPNNYKMNSSSTSDNKNIGNCNNSNINNTNISKTPVQTLKKPPIENINSAQNIPIPQKPIQNNNAPQNSVQITPVSPKPSFLDQISFPSEIEFLKELVWTFPTVNPVIPFTLRKVTDFGKINSRKLRLSLECGCMSDFSYGMNALVALSLSSYVSIKAINWIVEIGTALLKDAFGVMCESDDNYPCKGALAFLVFIRNLSLSVEDATYLCQNEEFVYVLLLIALWSDENVLSLYSRNVIYTLSFHLSFDSFNSYLLDTFDDFVETIETQLSSVQTSLHSTLAIDSGEYQSTRYDWIRSILIRDFRILCSFLSSFNNHHQTIVTLNNTFVYIRTPRKKNIFNILWHNFLLPLISGPLYKFCYSYTHVIKKLSEQQDQLSVQLLLLWYQSISGNCNFCIQDFRNAEMSLEFCYFLLEENDTVLLDFATETFSISCLCKSFVLFVNMFSLPHLSVPQNVVNADSGLQILFNSRLGSIAVLLGRMIELGCFANCTEVLGELEKSRESLIMSFAYFGNTSMSQVNWYDKLYKILATIVSFV